MTNARLLFLLCCVLLAISAQEILNDASGNIVVSCADGSDVVFQSGDTHIISANEVVGNLTSLQGAISAVPDLIDAATRDLASQTDLAVSEAAQGAALANFTGYVGSTISALQSGVNARALKTDLAPLATSASVSTQISSAAAATAATYATQTTVSTLSSNLASNYVLKSTYNAAVSTLTQNISTLTSSLAALNALVLTINATVAQLATNLGTLQSPGKSCLDILQKARNPLPNVLTVYYVAPTGGSGAPIPTLCDMVTDGGGWTMVASNAAADSTFPVGGSRCGFFLNIPNYNTVDRANVDKDYLFGPDVDFLSFTQGRVYSKRYATNAVVDVAWMQSPPVRQSLTNNGLNQGGTRLLATNTASNVGCGNCNHMNLDAQFVEGGCDSNSNQRTIGGVCTQGNPDPISGTYIGHGASEGSWAGEGNYYSAESGCTGYDFNVYTTWVR